MKRTSIIRYCKKHDDFHSNLKILAPMLRVGRDHSIPQSVFQALTRIGIDPNEVISIGGPTWTN